MKTYPDSIPYALEEALGAARLVTEDDWIHWKVLTRVLRELAEEVDTERTASEIIFSSMTTAYKALGVSDPYENEKARSNKAVLGLEDQFRERIAAAPDRLAAAAQLALHGVAVGAGVNHREDANRLLDEASRDACARDDSEAFVRVLARAESIFYILNNCGEAVLDKLFIEELARKGKVTVMVRKTPILNDVTAKDAESIGLASLENVEIMTPGAPMLGLWLEKCNKKVRKAFDAADVVISKGQSNYESLASAEREVFFLLRARSIAVAQELGVPAGSPVLLHHQGSAAAAKASSGKNA